MNKIHYNNQLTKVPLHEEAVDVDFDDDETAVSILLAFVWSCVWGVTAARRFTPAMV